jgi:hypothetical protein
MTRLETRQKRARSKWFSRMTRIVDEVDRVAYHEGAYILHRESPGSKVLVKRCLPELPTRLLWRAHHKLAVKITCRAVSRAMKPEHGLRSTAQMQCRTPRYRGVWRWPNFGRRSHGCLKLRSSSRRASRVCRSCGHRRAPRIQRCSRILPGRTRTGYSCRAEIAARAYGFGAARRRLEEHTRY